MSIRIHQPYGLPLLCVVSMVSSLLVSGAPPAVAAGLLGPTASAHARQSVAVVPLVNAQVGALPPQVVVVAGHQFFARGSGFRAGEAVRLSVTFPLYTGTLITQTRTTQADATGASAAALMVVPRDTQHATVTLTAAGAASKRSARAHIYVVYRPSLHLVTPTVHPGEPVLIDGAGFVPTSHIRVSVVIPIPGAPTVTLSRVVTADDNGGLSTSIGLPAGTRAGIYAVTAIDTARGFEATSQLTVLLRPTIALQPTSAVPGSTITVIGGGFPGAVVVRVHAVFPLYRGGSQTVSTATVSQSGGSFSTHLRIPARAASGTVEVVSIAPGAQASARLDVRRIGAIIALSPASVIPGSSVSVQGSGYLAGDRVDIVLVLTLINGSKTTIRSTVTTDSHGAFRTTIQVPADAAGGVFTVVGTSEASDRAPSAQLSVARLAASIVALPTTAVPGTQVTVNGFGFAAGELVRVYLDGRNIASAGANGGGQFSVKATIPVDTASGSYQLTAQSTSGRKAAITLAVERRISTHFYFASEYTGRGYANYLTFLNLTAIRARVTITYDLRNGTTQTRSINANPHTRYTEDVNADLGPGLSAAAEVAADVPIVAEGVVYHGSGGAVVPGSPSPSTVWYFANGNTGHHYREYIAVQNPNHGSVQIAVHFLPTHGRPFTIYRTMAPTSRTTVKVNAYVPKDAVGVTISSNGPVVANRSIFIRHGITSKNGVTAPERTWYFAAGPRDPGARHYIGVINPSGQSAYITLHTYGEYGEEVGTVYGYLRPYARVGYLINRIAHRTDVAIMLSSSTPVVAEQTTYIDAMHDASTDTFGVALPARSWSFAVVNTSTTRGEDDALDLFNPNLVPVPIVVQFVNASGGVLERTYIVNPLNHQHIDVASVEPSGQLALVAVSNYPFVSMNRYAFNYGRGADTSTGSPG